jgi:hypothetical protein
VTPPSVLLDLSYLTALIDAQAPETREVRAHYFELVEQTTKRAVRLRALGSHIDLVSPRPSCRHLLRTCARCVDARLAPRHTLFAPVERIHVAGQHRRAAAKAHSAAPPHLAQALVIAHREKIRRIATVDPSWRLFDVEVHMPITVTLDDGPPGYVPFKAPILQVPPTD